MLPCSFMKNRNVLLLLLLALLASGCGASSEDQTQDSEQAASDAMKTHPQQARLAPDALPETRRQPESVDTFYGTAVPDPYRWLENDTSAETEAWVKKQNEVAFGYLEKIPYRDTLHQRLMELQNYERYSAPFTEGRYTYFYKNDGLQDHSVLYREVPDQAEPEVFLDPNTFSKDGTTSLAGLSFSPEGDLCAYLISEDGSDWRKLIVIDTETKEQIGDTLHDIKFSGASWRGREGFYYSSYDKPKDGSVLSARTQQHRLYFHKLGTPQSQDALIFGGEDDPRRYVGAGVTENQNFLIVSGAQTTTGNQLYFQDLRRPDAPLTPVVENFEHDHNVLTATDRHLYVYTTREAPNGKIVKVDVQQPEPEHWETVIPEKEFPLTASSANDFLFTEYLEDAISKVSQHRMDGSKVRDIELPGPGSAYGFGGKDTQRILYYGFTSYTQPATLYRYDTETGESTLYKASGVDFDPEQYTSRQVFYRSKDSTRIPMIIVHKKGLKRDGQNPTMLYGYGGFSISLTPSFSTERIVWLENGGVYAVPNLRGGGEYGEAWHQAGTRQQKQNVFDDFIAAAEYLIAEGYTDSARLALNGGSNGGLLVGAVMTQRPQLARVAIPQVGVLDMLRYHKFTAGAGWAYDYGTADESEVMFRYLLGYSPYHNIEEGVAYPATMVMTGDHDDRVVPAHSFKFGARLQERHEGPAPVILRIATNTGHGAGKPIRMQLQETADKYAFAFWNMGIESLERTGAAASQTAAE